ncbi:hypothetical protein [Tenacibaculum jejuense]|uniref:Uncharacterized protein n=1 Tax=Tenacibaculum jejuense TaxID=584609 RepID=A0A238U8H6_9FLAO|nr:hypothetical protein [Tenacibaculum jejuense]SNR15491.1 conserved membrane protein of unknown function [Tenacibaculum jejuense]
MKVKTKRDVLKLQEKIKQELGLDVSKYKDEEVVENFVEILLLPNYIVSWVIRPIFISFLIYIFGFYVFNLVHIEYVFYAIIGFGLFIVFGISFGFLSLVFKMKNDILEIVDYSLDILKLAIQDISKINNQITVDNKNDVLSLVFKGIIHIVTIPLLTKSVTSKIPFIGRIASSLIKRVLTVVSNRLEFKEDNIEDFVASPLEEKHKLYTAYMKTIIATSNGLETFISFVFRVLKIPMLVFFFFSSSALLLFLYLIN